MRFKAGSRDRMDYHTHLKYTASCGLPCKPGGFRGNQYTVEVVTTEVQESAEPWAVERVAALLCDRLPRFGGEGHITKRNCRTTPTESLSLPPPLSRKMQIGIYAPISNHKAACCLYSSIFNSDCVYKGTKAISSYVYATRGGHSHSAWNRRVSKIGGSLSGGRDRLIQKYDLKEKNDSCEEWRGWRGFSLLEDGFEPCLLRLWYKGVEVFPRAELRAGDATRWVDERV